MLFFSLDGLCGSLRNKCNFDRFHCIVFYCNLDYRVQNSNEGFQLPTFSVQVLIDSYYNLGMEQCIYKKSDNEMYIYHLYIYLISYNIKIKFLSQARFPNYFNEVWSTSISTIISLLLLPIFSPTLESNAFQFYFQVIVNCEHFVIVAYFQIATMYEH
jgi:hypothetical protein